MLCSSVYSQSKAHPYSLHLKSSRVKLPRPLQNSQNCKSFKCPARFLTHLWTNAMIWSTRFNLAKAGNAFDRTCGQISWIQPLSCRSKVRNCKTLMRTSPKNLCSATSVLTGLCLQTPKLKYTSAYLQYYTWSSDCWNQHSKTSRANKDLKNNLTSCTSKYVIPAFQAQMMQKEENQTARICRLVRRGFQP